jgi:hypothetical protein
VKVSKVEQRERSASKRDEKDLGPEKERRRVYEERAVHQETEDGRESTWQQKYEPRRSLIVKDESRRRVFGSKLDQ